MRGIWSQVIALAVIVQVALVTGKALLQQNQQLQHQLDQQPLNETTAQKRVGYDYPAPPDDFVNPFQDHEVVEHHEEHHEHHIEEHHDEHHDHHDPGYWKKKLIWKEGYKKIWKSAKKKIWKPSWKKVWQPYWIPAKVEWKEAWKQIWVRDYKDIWVPGVKKIWKPVWISEWFPSPDHHEHLHDAHSWDRNDKNAAANQKSGAANNNIEDRVDDHHDHHDPGYWKKKLIWKEGYKKIWKKAKKQIWKPSWKKIWKPIVIPKKLKWKESWKQIWVVDYKDIWVPGVKKIFKPVWISEWFPSPDHHEHVHESHGWDRSDNNAETSQTTVAINKTIAEQLSPKEPQQSIWKFPK